MSCYLVRTDYVGDVDVTFEKYVAQNQPYHRHPAIITYEITVIIRLISGIFLLILFVKFLAKYQENFTVFIQFEFENWIKEV